MRVLILNQFYAPDISPTAQLAASLAEHRAALGDRVTIITSRTQYTGRPFEARHADPPGVRVIRVPLLGLGRSRTLGRLLDYLVFGALATLRSALLRRHDVVVSLTTPPFLVLAGVAHRLTHRGSRLVLWNMDCYPDAAERFGTMKRGGAASRLFRAMKRWALRRVDHVVCLDTAMRDLMRSSYTASGRALPMSVIPNWERASAFPDVAPGEAPERWPGYDDRDLRDKSVILYLGNAGMGHRFDSVIAAAEQLRRSDVVFLFVGGGIRWPDLEAAQARGVDSIALRSYVSKDETPAVLAGAAAALIVLDDEALGVMSPSKLHANLAMRAPIVYVGPAGSNVDEALVRFECGIRVDQGDAAGLVAAVRAVTEPGARERYGERSRRAFDEAYSDERTLPQWDALLASLGRSAEL